MTTNTKMTESEYRAHPALNFTDLKAIETSPLHFKEIRDHGHDSSKAFDFGSLVHMAALELAQFNKSTVILPDGIKKGNSNAYKEFKAEHEGKHILSPEEDGLYRHIANKVHSDEHAKALLKSRGTEFEVPLFWEYRGHKLKSKTDWRNPSAKRRPHMGDLKSTETISPDAFLKKAYKFHYHAQFWYYQAANEYNTGERLPFYVVAVEKKRPFDVAVFHVPDETLDYGKDTVDRWLDEYERCLESKHWPGVAAGEILTFKLPEWVSSDGDEDLVID